MIAMEDKIQMAVAMLQATLPSLGDRQIAERFIRDTFNLARSVPDEPYGRQEDK